MKGFLITFEGPEKSGKSTQAHLLSGYLKARGYKTLFLREPGSTEIGEKMRRLLLDEKNTKMSAATEMLLYMAARAQLVQEVIRPALARGTVVLCDRFQDSTFAYQGFGCGLSVAMIQKIGSFVAGDIEPDLTLLLDFWRSAAHLKNHKTPDRIEMRPDAFHRRVKRGYLFLAGKYPQRIKIVRVARDRLKTQNKIREIVDQCLLRKSSVRRAPSRS